MSAANFSQGYQSGTSYGYFGSNATYLTDARVIDPDAYHASAVGTD
jgi:hypothetical protein